MTVTPAAGHLWRVIPEKWNGRPQAGSLSFYCLLVLVAICVFSVDIFYFLMFLFVCRLLQSLGALFLPF